MREKLKEILNNRIRILKEAKKEFGQIKVSTSDFLNNSRVCSCRHCRRR